MLDHEGRVSECTGAHIFFVKDGALHTPTTEWILDGITRACVVDLARARGIAVYERSVTPDELESFSECFIVGTAAEVTAVREIKGNAYQPGAVTQTLMSDYDELVRGRLTVRAAE